jgi:hypothetical protein
MRWRCLRALGLLAGVVLLASCTLGAYFEDVPPTTVVPLPTPTLTLTPSPGRTPSPLATRLPTPCADGRIAGKVCLAGADVYARSCCPPWEAVTTSDGGGGFAFEALTVGTFTVTCGLYSRVVALTTCESQVNVDLCPPPTQPPLAEQ